MMLPVGLRLGPYEIVAAIGAGGMGEVYRARDTRLDRDVAVKVLPASVNDPRAQERFRREARAIAALQHPNICVVYDVGEAPDGRSFLVMELLQGETLQRRLVQGAFDVPALIEIGAALADALDSAHRAGILHRDLKPANVFITSRGPKILDFGLAKALTPDVGVASVALTAAPDLSLTDPGTAVGTVAYMSPEQLRGEDLDVRTDLFSLGAVLYEMSTGRQAFGGPTTAVISAAILHQEPPAPAGPPRLQEVILKAIEKDRGLRYQHASELRTDLQRLKRDATTATAVAASVQPSRRPRLIAAMLAAVVVATAAVAFFSSRRVSALTDRDTIVLADFVNTTGDPVFDGALRQGLAVQLGQSPFLSLISDQRIRTAMGLLGRPADARLTPELARDICERTASAAVLEGSIASLGSQYVLGLRAKRCRTGDVLVEEQVQAARKEDVLGVLSQIAKTFRTRVGESLATIQQHDRPLEEATTPSLDALKAYSAAMNLIMTTGISTAVPLLKRAVEIDPEFAMAQAQLGLCYSVVGESVLSRQSTTKAYELRNRASDRERFFITAMYDRQVTGNLDKADQTFVVWTQSYPRDALAHGLWSGFTLQGSGKFARTIEEANRTIELDPASAPAYFNIAFANIYMDRVPEGERALQRAADRNIDTNDGSIAAFQLAFLKGDQPAMDRVTARASAGASPVSWITHLQALVLARSGRLAQATETSRQARDAALKRGDQERAASVEAAVGVWEALVGRAALGRQHALAALAGSDGRDVQYAAAFALAFTGDLDRTEALANDLDKRFPEDTSVRFTYLPTLRAQLALGRGNAARAVDGLASAVPYEHTVPAVNFVAFYGGRNAAYVRGMARLAEHRGAEAAAEFRDIIANRGLILGDPIGALAHVQLGRALAMSGDAAKARASYESFLALWKDADAGLPILEQARAEYAALR